MKRLLVVALLACGGSADERVIRFSPDPELAEVATAWAARWSAATGRDIRVEAGGIPIRAVDETSLLDGRCGATRMLMRGDETVSVQDIEIDRTPPQGCAGWGYSLAHEMAHALGARGHTATGLLAESPALGVVHGIDADALELVCEHLVCTAFNPEMQ